MLKKWLSAMLVCCMIAALALPNAVAAGGTLTVDSVEAVQGDADTVYPVNIVMSGNEGVITMSFKVTFADELELISVDSNSELFSKDNTRKSDFTSPFPISLGDAGAEADMTGNGVVVTLNFKVKEGTAEGDYAVAIDPDSQDNWNFDVDEVKYDCVDGKITVAAPIHVDDNVTVKFDADGGTPVPEDKTITKGNTATEPTAPTKDGYDFDGWYNGADKWDFSQAVEADMTLKAKWKEIVVVPEKVKVTFDADNGSAVEVKEIDKDTAVEAPADPTKANYSFNGWYNGTDKWDFSEKVSADMTLKAQWTEIVVVPEKVKVTFDADNGSAVEVKEIDKGTAVEAPADPTRDGYDFAGWFDGETKWDFSNTVSEDVTLKAQWTEIPIDDTVTVKFDADGGTPVPDDFVVTKGGTVTEPTAPSKEGYDFDGWYNGTDKWDFSHAVEADMTLKAQWTEIVVVPEKVKVTFDADNGSAAETKEIDKDTAVAEPAAPTKEGYDFDGWYNGAAKWDFSEKVSADMTLTAHWTKKAGSSETGNTDPITPDVGKKGCYVATSVYGSYDCPEVWTLRRYRDEVLGETWYGRMFIKAYYTVSPTLVKWFGDSDWFQSFFRARLDQMVDGLQAEGFASTPYEDINW